MTTTGLPAQLLNRFRLVSFDRLERIEAAWQSLMEGTGACNVEVELGRELHTLKGDAHVIGFAEIATICQRLEDLLAIARERRFRVPEDIDLVVGMAIQFVGLLLRRKSATTQASGIDVEAFVAELQTALDDWRTQSRPLITEPLSSVRLRPVNVSALVSSSARQRLSALAAGVYLEHVRVGAPSAQRLRDIWTGLKQEIADLEAVPLAPLVARHVSASKAMAASLGKDAEVMVDVGDLRLATETLDAINTVVVHALRNAIDHGIEPLPLRMERSKRARGAVWIEAREFGGGLELQIRDDGAGVDLEQVRRRAVALGFLSSADAASAPEAQLLRVLFLPGFSTRESAGDFSGRGVGLDAVRASVERLGGQVDFETTKGSGSCLRVRMPQAYPVIDVLLLAASGAVPAVCIASTWAAELTEDDGGTTLAEMLEVTGGADLDATNLQTLVLRRDGIEARLLVPGAPARVSAKRPCPTPPDASIEIVEIDGVEAVLIRPETCVAAGDR